MINFFNLTQIKLSNFELLCCSRENNLSASAKFKKILTQFQPNCKDKIEQIQVNNQTEAQLSLSPNNKIEYLKLETFESDRYILSETKSQCEASFSLFCQSSEEVYLNWIKKGLKKVKTAGKELLLNCQDSKGYIYRFIFSEPEANPFIIRVLINHVKNIDKLEQAFVDVQGFLRRENFLNPKIIIECKQM